MEWVCPDCDRRYDDPPEECVCGGQPVPEGTTDTPDLVSRVASNVYRTIFDPQSLDRNLLAGGPRVQLAFRLIVAFSLLLSLAVVVALLL